MKTILVIGLSKFGIHLAEKLMQLDNEVVVIDRDSKVVESFDNKFTDAFIGDCRNEEVLKSLGVHNFDLCFVTIDQDFQSSLEITAMLKENGAKYVISNANRDRQADFLKKIGADEVIYPEKESAIKNAIKFTDNHISDFIPMTEDYSVFEIDTPESWLGKTIAELNIRKKYEVNIVAIKNKDGFNPVPDAQYTFKEEDHIVVIGKNDIVEKLAKKGN